jgi:hypothetical protein
MRTEIGLLISVGSLSYNGRLSSYHKGPGRPIPTNEKPGV